MFKIDDDFIKDTIIYCNKADSIKIKENKKLYNSKDNKNWLIIIDKNNTDIDELFKQVKKYKKISKTSIKSKTSKISKTSIKSKTSKNSKISIKSKTSKNSKISIKSKLSKNN